MGSEMCIRDRRNVPNTAPYFHDGRLTSLEQVVTHYSTQPGTDTGKAGSGQIDLRPFALSTKEVKQLTAFLLSLSAIK